MPPALCFEAAADVLIEPVSLLPSRNPRLNAPRSPSALLPRSMPEGCSTRPPLALPVAVAVMSGVGMQAGQLEALCVRLQTGHS